MLVNFVEYWETSKSGKKQRFSWVTDHEITDKNLFEIMKGGRARWHIESVPQAHKAMIKGLIMKCGEAMEKIVVGPPKSAVRRGLQTTLSGCY